MRLIDSKHKVSSIAMIAMGVSFAALYPRLLLIHQAGWIWDYPARNLAFEHMFMAIYAVWGLFLIWGARDPVGFLPLIDFTIVAGTLHATIMLADALQTPGMDNHLGLHGDVIGTYLAPAVLILCHPRHFYLNVPWRRRAA
jgi:hypothetical protein